MKYSIVIVAYEAQDKLIRCLESLYENAPEKTDGFCEAEIIVIDNSPFTGISKIPSDLLKKLLRRYARLIETLDGNNRGFAEGCNYGASKANGQYIVLVNPDTVVYPGWAERLEAHFKPGVGAVGPISNFVAGYQNSRFHVQGTNVWGKVAQHAARGNDKRGMDTKLLIGFFMMIPRKVWEEVGGLDPQFFLGCDDLDFSLRLRDAGYQLIIATDTLVYHEGHCSFEALGAESVKLNMEAEQKLFAKLRLKYGPKLPSSTELWGCEILPTEEPTPMKLSVSMIVLDEIENLKELLPQLWFADEVVIVDTGLYPDTMITMCGIDPLKHAPGTPWELEGNLYGVPVKWRHKPWDDSFANPRNESLKHCTGDYVLWLDADDRVPEVSARQIREAFDRPLPMTKEKRTHFSIVLKDFAQQGVTFLKGQSRIFPNIPGIKWKGRCHESYRHSANAMKLNEGITTIQIEHHGYSNPEILKKKHERNIRLLQMDDMSPLNSYMLGRSLQGLKRFEEAEDAYKMVLTHKWSEQIDPDFGDQVRFMLAEMIYQRDAGATEEMLQYLIPNKKPDSEFLLAEVYLKMGNVDEAHALYTKYASHGYVEDCFGSEFEHYRNLSLMRLEGFQKREVVNV